MQSPWDYPDFDGHEAVHFFTDLKSGLRVVIAVHSTARGPAAGGVRFWHYARSDAAVADALRLSRGMSFKNAMADLPVGGGKAVILAPEDRSKSSELLAAFGKAVDSLGGAYITAADVGAGGDPGPHRAYGVFLGVKAAARRALGKDSLAGLHIAVQGAGSVGGGLARLAAA